MLAPFRFTWIPIPLQLSLLILPEDRILPSLQISFQIFVLNPRGVEERTGVGWNICHTWLCSFVHYGQMTKLPEDFFTNRKRPSFLFGKFLQDKIICENPNSFFKKNLKFCYLQVAIMEKKSYNGGSLFTVVILLEYIN